MLNQMIYNAAMKTAGIKIPEMVEAHGAGMVERAAGRKMILAGAGQNTWAEHAATTKPAFQASKKLGTPVENMSTYRLNASHGAGGGFAVDQNPGTFRANTDPVVQKARDSARATHGTWL